MSKNAVIHTRINADLKAGAEQILESVGIRVSEGGHNVPEETIKRRFNKGLDNLQNVYKDCVDTWVVFDNSGTEPVVIEESQ